MAAAKNQTFGMSAASMTQGYPSPINNAAASSDLLPTRARRMAVEITKNLLQGGVPV
ncbi:hypothetical protein ACN24L_13250 [Streptomyces microflavus]